MIETIPTQRESQAAETKLGALIVRAPVHQFASFAAALLLWELAARLLRFSFLPPVSSVVQRSLELLGQATVRGHLVASVTSLVTGYGLAVVAGIALGVLMGRFRRVNAALDIYLDALLAAPSLIYVPVLFTLLGVSRSTQTAVVFIYAVFVIAANTAAGVRQVDHDLVDMARSFGASRVRVLRRVILPGALPLILSGLNIGVSRGVKGMINGELFIALVGLGALIRRYGSRFDAEGVFGVLVFVAIIALVAAAVAAWTEARLTAWRRE